MAGKLVGSLAAKGGQSHSRPIRAGVTAGALAKAPHRRDEDATRVRIVVAAITLVDMGALGSAAGKRFASRMKVTPGRG